MLRDPHHARAAALVDSLNLRLLAHAAGRRQAHGRGEGARAPAGLAQPRRRLDVLTEPGPGAKPVRVTPLGYQTATRALPPVLASLPASDARRRAADVIADCAERVSGARGGDMQGGDISGLSSDGGATTRVKWAARLRVIEAVANGWPIGRDGRIAQGAPRIALPLGRPSAKRQEIKAFALLLAVCVEGQDMREILVAHGWSPHGKHRAALTAATLDLLERVGAGLGYGRAPRKDDLTRNVSLT